MLKKNTNLIFIIGIMLSIVLIFGCTQSKETEVNSDINELILNKSTTQNPLFGTCPRENENQCTGECGAFIDNDNDGFCDRSFAE